MPCIILTPDLVSEMERPCGSGFERRLQENQENQNRVSRTLTYKQAICGNHATIVAYSTPRCRFNPNSPMLINPILPCCFFYNTDYSVKRYAFPPKEAAMAFERMKGVKGLVYVPEN